MKSPPRAPSGMPADAPAPMSESRAEVASTQSTGSSDADDEATPPPAASPAAPPPQPAPVPMRSVSQKADPAEVARDRDRIIYTAHIHVAVYQVEQSVAAVEAIGRDAGGFLAKKADREISIRVPRRKFDAALAAIDKVGDVIHRDVQAEDVTAEHVDLEIRIQAARAMQKRLADLLSRANVKEALEIEKEMHRVTEELERLEGRLKVLRDKVAYATLTVTFQPRNATLHASNVRLPFPWLSELGLSNLLTLTEDR